MKAVSLCFVMCLICLSVDARSILPDLSTDQLTNKLSDQSVDRLDDFMSSGVNVKRTKRGVITDGNCPKGYKSLPIGVLYCVPCATYTAVTRKKC